jgi:hypothetical protein
MSTNNHHGPLTPEQVKTYETTGFLVLPDCFSPAELEVMHAQLPGLFAEDSPRRVLEKNGNIVRSVYGAHTTNDVFQGLTRQPRLAKAAMQLLGSDVYVYQFKINAKAAFGGDIWEWHQDYVFWRNEDGMPTDRVINAVVFLNEVNEFNGPLFLIPGSHRDGVIEPLTLTEVPQGYEDGPAWISNLTADLKYSLDQETVARLVKANGLVAPKGQAGSVMFFHGNLAHGSSPNMSPFDRKVVIVTYNSVENRLLPIPKPPRPDFLVSRDTRPIVPLPDGARLA